MKKLFCRIFVILSLASGAQNFKITTGEEFETTRFVWTSEAIEPDATGFYFIRNTNAFTGKYVIHKLDLKTSKTIYMKEVQLKHDVYKGSESYIYGIYNKNGKLFMFSKVAKAKSMRLVLQEFNNTTGEEIGEPVIVDELETTRFSKEMLDIQIAFSPDNKKMLITTEIKENKKEQKVYCKLYDLNGFKKIWEKQAITTFKNSTVFSSQYRVDNNDNLSYVFRYARSEHKDDENNLDDIEFGIAMISGKNNMNKLYPLPCKGITNTAIHIKIAPNNLILCTGQYALGEIEREKNTKRGFFLITLDPETMTAKSESYDYLNDDLTRKLLYDKNEISTFIYWSRVGNYFLNGSLYVVKQQEYSISKSNGYTDYFENEIVVFKYNKDYKLEWQKLIPRRTLGDANGLNVMLTNKLHFIYYENPKNLEKFPDTENFIPGKYEKAKAKSAIMVCATMDDKGNVTRAQVPFGEVETHLEEEKIDHVFINETQSLIVPVSVTKSKRRYDLLKIE
jgi:hypothetical protein